MGKKKILAVVALLSVLLVVPLAFSSGFISMNGYLFFSDTGTPSSSATSTPDFPPTVSVDPVTVIDETLQSPGSTFSVHVDVSGPENMDLFAWQINMSWNASILNVNKIIQGEFLNQTTSENKTSSYKLGFVINATDNDDGYTGMGESILGGDFPGINGSGRLVSIEFLVVGYGCTNLTISLTGDLRTMLLNSTGGEISLPPENVLNGYFRNKFTGDADGDGTVNVFDILKVKYHWYPGPPTGLGGYDRNVDIDDDGSINVFDILLVKANWD